MCVWCVSICMDANANLCVKGANIEENIESTKVQNPPCIEQQVRVLYCACA